MIDFRKELLRTGAALLILLLFAAWLGSPYLSGRLIGGGDALWYHAQIADALAQFRQGEFPVWVGQSNFAFNGAVHPFRSAPLLHNFVGLLNLLTGQTKPVSDLVGLSVFLIVVGAAASAFGALLWFSPGRPVRAAVLAGLYVACPGVVGLVYAQDLYMSVTAIPFLPWAVAGALQMGRGEGSSVPWVFGASLGALWWAHAPIALWATAATALVQLAVGVASLRDRALLAAWLGEVARAGVAFALLAAFPLVSVITLREAGQSVVTVTMDRAGILREVNQLLPWIFLPLQLDTPLLSCLQPGYAVLALLLASTVLAAAGWTFGRFRVLTGVACTIFLLLFVVSLPGVTAALWSAVPEFWLGITNYWPNQRIIPIVAALAVVTFREVSRHRVEPAWANVFWTLVAIWGAYQGSAIRDVAVRHTRTESETALLALPENMPVSAYSYQQLPQRPATFIHGVTDPEMEMRWLNRTGKLGVSSNRDLTELESGAPFEPLHLSAQQNPGIFVSAERWQLQPGQRYLLTFRFGRERLRGILRLMGDTLYRSYVLPHAGDSQAFGTAPGQDRSIVVWTSRTDGAETFHLEFIPQMANGELFDPADFASVQFTPVARPLLAVRVDDLIPLRFRVQGLGPIALQTPRMYIPGWKADLDGRPVAVRRSAQGLVEMDIPTGGGEVTLRYEGSLALRLTFWVSGAAFVLFVGYLAGCGFRAAHRVESEPDAQLATK